MSGRRREGSRGPPGRALGLVLSLVSSALVLALVGCVAALLYPVLKELRGLRAKGADGTEQRMLGFWSVSALSLVVAGLCSASSWILTHLDSAHCRPRPHSSPQDSDGARLGYGMAVLNGAMAMVTVMWSLS
ncbi:ADP-ribosylation factor-like protein 6-interacting protein 6 [Eucyclogobius newberryi]|uniref:ADP-ribosylation factor-like protein 6-interacting protein 6 n=1 Tax=Eucyclogobius newberryi TaxID=166745 RepID=UPI003B5AE30E